jgi:protease-4
MAKKNLAFLILFGAALTVTLMFAALYLGIVFFSSSDVTFGDAVAVVDIRGAIYYDLSKIHEIESHRDNEDIRAILVFINSPGGGVTASEAIYQALQSAREKKPVVAFMASVAASGGYYVACAADSIVAHESTLTGSIGVIASFLHTEGLYRKIGLEVTVVKTGRYKDIGSPYRSMTEEEQAYIGELLDTTYRQFTGVVSTRRDMSLDRVMELSQGQLYSGQEAVELGLVDRLGTFEDALAMAGTMGGVTGKPRVVRKRKKRSLAARILGREAPRLPFSSEERIRLEYIIP